MAHVPGPMAGEAGSSQEGTGLPRADTTMMDLLFTGINPRDEPPSSFLSLNIGTEGLSPRFAESRNFEISQEVIDIDATGLGDFARESRYTGYNSMHNGASDSAKEPLSAESHPKSPDLRSKNPNESFNMEGSFPVSKPARKDRPEGLNPEKLWERLRVREDAMKKK